MCEMTGNSTTIEPAPSTLAAHPIAAESLTNHSAIADQTAAADFKRPTWPAAFAVIGGWILPARTADRTRNASLLVVWLLHVLSAAMGFCLILFLIAWAEADYAGLSAAAHEWMRFVGEVLLDDLGTAQGGLAFVGIFALIEAVHLGVALIVMAWGALDEPLRRSFANSIRQTWLHTWHFLPAIFVVGVTALSIELLDRNWQKQNPPPVVQWPVHPNYPALAPSDPGYAQAMADYNTAYQAWLTKYNAVQQVYGEWSVKRPWYLTESETIIAPVVLANLVWVLWALLRAVGAPRNAPLQGRPPLCADCGYNLLMLPLDGRCPECGTAVIQSIGPDSQPGAPWERRRASWRRAWARTSAMAMRAPSNLGRSLRVASVPRDHRAFLAWHVPLYVLIGAAGMICAVIIPDGLGAFTNDPQPIILVAIMFGLLCGLGAVGMANACAVLVGLSLGIPSRRNLLPAAIQMSCYLATYLVIWQVIGGALGVAMVPLERAHVFDTLHNITGIHEELVFGLTFAIPNVILGIVFLRLIYRGTAGARHANK